MMSLNRTSSVYSQDDPLSLALRPSPHETEGEKSARLQQEAEAKRVSDRIDEELRLDRERLKKSKNDVKVRVVAAYTRGT